MAHDESMHCECGHEFGDASAYRDDHGTWCPECGNTAHTGPAPSAHRYWYFVNMPEIGVRWRQGWCFGTDAGAAARNAIATLATRERVTGAAYLLPGDVRVTHCTACSCLPPEMRSW